MRLANGFDTSSPVPIIVVDGKPASAAKLPGKSEGTWEDWQIKQVSQGTGNFDSAAVNQALTEACGSVDQVSHCEILLYADCCLFLLGLY